MSKTLFWLLFASLGAQFMSFSWGFYAHQEINRLAVFTLPPEMIGFYKANILYITEAAVNADRRRYAVKEEAPRHFIDADHYGDSGIFKLPMRWQDAVDRYGEDTLNAYGILPWHVIRVYAQLRNAFAVGDPQRILRLSADLGHYIGDAHVPLHTTENYNGQLTGQEGIHAFWESRLPELFAERYDFFVGRASYLPDPQKTIWEAVRGAHRALDSVLTFEKELTARMGEQKFSFETKGRMTQRVYAQEFAAAYHTLLAGMVERQMRAAIACTGDFWFTAWMEAGQPDLTALLQYKPDRGEIQQRWIEWEKNRNNHPVRVHDP